MMNGTAAAPGGARGAPARMGMAAAAIILVALAGQGSPAYGQTLAESVRAAPDGPVRFHFAARPGVCGHERGVHIRDDDGTSVMRGGGMGDDWTSRCEEGPVRVELAVEDRRVVDLDTRVGRARSGPGADLGERPPAEAAAYLLGLARTASGSVGEDAIFAAVLARDVRPHRELLAIAADRSLADDVRGAAVFWSVEAGASLSDLRALYDGLDGSEVRKQVLFAYSRLDDDPAAAAELVRVAREPGSEDVRETAIFWLGQAAGRAVTRDLEEMVDDESLESDLREHAVFVLSQRPRDEAIPALLAIATEHADPRIRQRAMFWLAQSGDPRAIRLFEEILIR